MSESWWVEPQSVFDASTFEVGFQGLADCVLAQDDVIEWTDIILQCKNITNF